MFLGRVVKVAIYSMLVRHVEVTCRDDDVVVQMKAFFPPAIAARYRYVYTRRDRQQTPAAKSQQRVQQFPECAANIGERRAENRCPEGFRRVVQMDRRLFAPGFYPSIPSHISKATGTNRPSCTGTMLALFWAAATTTAPSFRLQASSISISVG
jgi:hypothetical protein